MLLFKFLIFFLFFSFFENFYKSTVHRDVVSLRLRTSLQNRAQPPKGSQPLGEPRIGPPAIPLGVPYAKPPPVFAIRHCARFAHLCRAKIPSAVFAWDPKAEGMAAGGPYFAQAPQGLYMEITLHTSLVLSGTSFDITLSRIDTSLRSHLIINLKRSLRSVHSKYCLRYA